MTDLSREKNDFDFVLTPVRHSSLLGTRVKFERSTSLGFSADTLVRVITGRSLRQMIKAYSYDFDLALIALSRSEKMGAKLHKSTVNSLDKVLGRHKVNEQPLTLNMLPAMPGSLTGNWRVLWRSIKLNIHPVYRRLFARLAYYDRIAAQIDRINIVQKRISSARHFFQPSLQYWRNQNLSLSSDAALLLDAVLHHVAWLDKELFLENSSVSLNMVLNLSEPSKRPMRHWFDRILNHSRCDNLLELHGFVAQSRLPWLVGSGDD